MEVVDLTFQPLYSWDTTPIIIEWEPAWAQEPVWTLWRRGKSLALTRIRNPDLPARSWVRMFLTSYHHQYVSANLWQLCNCSWLFWDEQSHTKYELSQFSYVGTALPAGGRQCGHGRRKNWWPSLGQ